MFIEIKSDQEIATQIAFSFIGRPYIWGGDDPSGFDCSGFVIEILKSVGKLPREGDWTAHSLCNRFVDEGKKVDDLQEGCLVFFGDLNKINHVEYMINDELSIGASGGGSSTKTAADAWKQNAYIKIRPVRKPFIIVDPFKGE